MKSKNWKCSQWNVSRFKSMNVTSKANYLIRESLTKMTVTMEKIKSFNLNMSLSLKAKKIWFSLVKQARCPKYLTTPIKAYPKQRGKMSKL